MVKIGHFGTPALVLAGAAVLALILHLTVPYGTLAEDGDTEEFSRSDAGDWTDVTDVGLASPGTTLAGAIVALVAGIAIVVCSFLPMPVTAARFIGWGAGTVGAVGGLLMLLSSLLWVGDGVGFSVEFGTVGVGGGLIGLILLITADTQATLWVISPIILTALAVVTLWCSFRLATDVVKTENGMRDRARQHMRSARWAIVLVAVAFLVPWSIASLDDSENPGDKDAVFIGAHTAMNVAEMSEGSGNELEAFQGMRFALDIFAATAWVALAMGLIGALGGVLASSGAPPAVSRATHFAALGAAVMFAWSAIMYVLAWAIFWNLPDGYDASNNMPGFAPILMVPVFLAWAGTLWGLTWTAIGTMNRGRAEAASFD